MDPPAGYFGPDPLNFNYSHSHPTRRTLVRSSPQSLIKCAPSPVTTNYQPPPSPPPPNNTFQTLMESPPPQPPPPTDLPPSPPPPPPLQTTDLVPDEHQQAAASPSPPHSPKPLSTILLPGSQDECVNIGDGHDNQPPRSPPSTPPRDTGVSTPNVAEKNPNFSPPPPGFLPLPPSPAPQREPNPTLDVVVNPNLIPNHEQPSSSPPPGFSPAPVPQDEVEMNTESSLADADQNPNLSDNHLQQIRFSPAAQELEVNPDSSLDDPIQSPNLIPQLQQSLSPPPASPARQEPDFIANSSLVDADKNTDLSLVCQENEQNPSTFSPPLAQFSAPSSPATLDPNLNANSTPMVADQIPDNRTDQEQQLSQLTAPPSSPPQAPSSPPPQAPSSPPPPSPKLVDDPDNNLVPSPSLHQSPSQHSPTPHDPESLNMNPESSKSAMKDLHQVLIPYKSPPQSHFSPSPESPPLKSPDPIPKADNDQDSPSQSPPSTPSESNSPKSTAITPIPEPKPINQVPVNMAASPPKKPIPWTHEETTNLIESYQEKWYSLKRGQLKAGQWEEVAIAVAARCGYDELTKTAKQCRHKIEKLRKRYRDEKKKPRSKANSWNFFKLMDRMERGPLPISEAQPLTMIEHDDPPQRSSGKTKKKDDSDSEFLIKCKQNKSKSVKPIASGGMRYVIKPGVNQKVGASGSGRVLRQLRSPVNRKRKNLFEKSDDEEEEEEADNSGDAGVEGGGDGVGQLAVQIRSFAERFVRMENKKIEMIRDTERYRMEMENKRMEMILETQQQLVETVHRAFNSSSHNKKLKLAAK